MPLERKEPTSGLTWLPRARLYLEDIEAIFAVLRDAMPDAEMEIEVNDLVGSVPSDVAGYAGPIRSLEISATSRKSPLQRYSVSLEGARGRFYATRFDAIARGVAHQVADIIRPRRTWLGKIGTTRLVAAAAGFSGGGVTWGVMSDTTDGPAWPAAVLLGMGLVLWLSLMPSDRPRTVALAAYRADAPTFWRRNRDQIALLIIGAILGVAGTLIARGFD